MSLPITFIIPSMAWLMCNKLSLSVSLSLYERKEGRRRERGRGPPATTYTLHAYSYSALTPSLGKLKEEEEHSGGGGRKEGRKACGVWEAGTLSLQEN